MAKISWIRLEYHNKAKNSHKFWQIKRNADVVWTKWGRVNTKGQSKEQEFLATVNAIDHVDSMISKKEAKGYKKVPGQTPYEEDDEEGFLESRVEETPENSGKKRLEDLIL